MPGWACWADETSTTLDFFLHTNKGSHLWDNHKGNGSTRKNKEPGTWYWRRGVCDWLESISCYCGAQVGPRGRQCVPTVTLLSSVSCPLIPHPAPHTCNLKIISLFSSVNLSFRWCMQVIPFCSLSRTASCIWRIFCAKLTPHNT